MMNNERPNTAYTRAVQEQVLEMLGLTLEPENGMQVKAIHFEPDEMTIEFHELRSQNLELVSPMIFHTITYPLVPEKAQSVPATNVGEEEK